MSDDGLEAFAAGKLRALERRQLKRKLVESEPAGPGRIRIAGRELVSFADNDYLGLSRDPLTIEASVAATRAAGAGAGASRLISGNHTYYAALERRLATLKGTDDAVAFGSGYLANVGLLPLFAGPSDLIAIDELAHSSLLAGVRLSGAKRISFAHNDAGDLDAQLAAGRTEHRHCLVVTEGVFSMDGDLAPLPALAEVAARHTAWLMTDDAHGLGVVGGGRGSTFAHAAPVDVPLQMGTLSKAVGCYGGYVCASRNVIDLVRTRAASLVYSTGLPPGVVAAATAALDCIAGDAERVARPLALAGRFTAALGLPAPESAIVPLVVGDVDAALAASRRLADAGFFVAAIRPPTVPPGTARLRFTFSAAHREADVDALAAAVAGLGLGSDCGSDPDASAGPDSAASAGR